MPQQQNQNQQQQNQQAGGRNSSTDTNVNSRDSFSSTESSQGRGASQEDSQKWSQQGTKEQGSGMNQSGQASRQAPGTERK
jgi:hypothetical protein